MTLFNILVDAVARECFRRLREESVLGEEETDHLMETFIRDANGQWIYRYDTDYNDRRRDTTECGTQTRGNCSEMHTATQHQMNA